MADGIITRQDLITDDALQFGAEYANNVNEAIDSNKALKESAKEMFDVYDKLKKAVTTEDFKNAKNQEALAINKATNAIKAREKAAIAAEKIKQQSIKTDKLALDLESKKIKSSKELTDLEKKKEQLKQQQIKTSKEQADLETRLQKINLEKERVRSQSLRNSKLMVDQLNAEERLTRQKLQTLAAENKVTETQTRQVKTQINVWKEQDALEKSLISTKRKRLLVTESTSRAQIAEQKALSDERREIKASLTAMGRLTLKRNQALKSVQEYQAKLVLGEKLSNKEQKEILESVRAFEKYDKAVKEVKNSTNQFQENVGNYPGQFKAIATGIKQLLPVLGIVEGVRVVFGVIRDSFQTVVDFDRQLIAVGKTTNIAGDDLKNFGREVVELGDRLNGVSVDGLLKSSEIAGQLGVKGTGNILRFAESIEKLKLTSDIISDEQVQNFAQFIEVSSDSFENADRLASVMTVLGNNFATTESKVLSNATEIQKGLSIYEASAEGVLGLGAATSALGNEADTSRTAIQKTFRVIESAVSTGKNLEQILALTNLTQAELSKQFSEDSTKVFTKFVKGLANAKDEGKSLNAVLQEVGIVETRAVTVIGSLASNYDLLANSVELATAEYENNLALTQEVEAATESVSSIIGDINDRWAAYVLKTDDANSITAKIANALKFVRDNLDTIVNTFVKYTAVLLAYIGVMKAVNLTTAAFSALKGAAIAAELKFALATGVGRKAVLAQAAAVRTAALAQGSLNVVMSATPWGLILGLLAAVVVAYKVFNDELSENERIQKKINDNIEARKKSLEETAESSRKFAAAQLKEVEDEFALRKAQEGDSEKLDKEEIQAKTKKLNSIAEINTMQLTANRNLIEQLEKDSKDKVEIAEKEALKLREIADRSSFYGNDVAAERAEETSSNLKVQYKNQVNNLRLANEQIINENKELNESIQELDKQNRIKEAEEEKKVDVENKKNRERRLKEAEAFREQLLSDKFNLKKAQLKAEIEDDKLIVDNDKESVGKRLQSLFDFVSTSIKLLEFERDFAISNAKGRADEIERIELEFSGNFNSIIRTRESETEKILKDSFNNTKERLDKRNAIEQKAIDDRITKEQEALTKELESGNLNNTQRLIRIRQFEEAITRIRTEGAEQRLSDAVNAIEAELKNPLLNPEQRASLEEMLAATKMALSDEVTANAIDNAERQAEAEQRLQEIKNSIILNASQNIAASLNVDAGNIASLLDSFLNKAEETGDAVVDKFLKVNRTLNQIGSAAAVVGDIFQSVFQENVSRIDEQIDAQQEYYEDQIQLAEGDQEQQDLLREEAELKRQVLEQRKRKEQEKAAKVAKATAIFSIGITTAQAVIGALAPPPIGAGPILGLPLSILAGSLGLAQIAAVLARPIPKYRYGTGNHRGGAAEVAEVLPEIIKEPGKKPFIQRERAVLDLAKGTQVYSQEGYGKNNFDKMKMDLIDSSFINQMSRIGEFEQNLFVSTDNSDVVEELRLNRKEIRRQNSRQEKSKNNDFNHQLFRAKNTDWDV